MSIKANNRFLVATASLLLLAIVVFSSCLENCGGKKEPPIASQQSGAEITVYFTKSRGSNTVTEGVVRPVPVEADSQLEYALEQLLKGPSNTESVQGFYSEIPKGTRLLEVADNNGKLTINLSRQFTSGGGSNSIKQRMAELEQTVRSVAKDQPVFVTVEGQKLETMGGEGLEVEQPITNNPG